MCQFLSTLFLNHLYEFPQVNYLYNCEILRYFEVPLDDFLVGHFSAAVLRVCLLKYALHDDLMIWCVDSVLVAYPQKRFE
jgi:hypothetical protein